MGERGFFSQGSAGRLYSMNLDKEYAADDTAIPPSTVSGSPCEEETAVAVQALSDEDIAMLKRAQKRNFIIALFLGIILLVVGFYAGKALRAGSEAAQASWGGASVYAAAPSQV